MFVIAAGAAKLHEGGDPRKNVEGAPAPMHRGRLRAAEFAMCASPKKNKP